MSICVQTPDYESQLKERMVASEIYARQIQIQQAKVRQKIYKSNCTLGNKNLNRAGPETCIPFPPNFFLYVNLVKWLIFVLNISLMFKYRLVKISKCHLQDFFVSIFRQIYLKSAIFCVVSIKANSKHKVFFV